MGLFFMTMKKYTEGNLFCVPLREGGVTVGLIARTAPRSQIILAYFLK